MWNAGKFVLFQLEGADEATWQALAAADYSTPGSAAALPLLSERWVVSALHEVVAKVTDKQERFDFGEAGR